MNGDDSAPARTAAEAAPAKINLALHVTGTRWNGYHTIETLIAFAEAGDAVEVSRAAADAFSAAGPFAAALPLDGSNLVLKARDLLRDAALEWDARRREGVPHWRIPSGDPLNPRGKYGDTFRWWATEVARTERAEGVAGGPVAIALSKRLPVASGIGGGSSDAAATLKALSRCWNLPFPPSRLSEMGSKLGADVPMCLHARPLLAKGIGDEIEPLGGFPAFDVVLANPGVAVSTQAVFKALERKRNAPFPPLASIRTLASLCDWLRETRNDLEAPATAVAPEIGLARKALDSAGALLSRMSGSGATCFGLFGSAEDARAAALAIRRKHPGWWVEATRTLPSPPEEDA